MSVKCNVFGLIVETPTEIPCIELGTGNIVILTATVLRRTFIVSCLCKDEMLSGSTCRF